MAVGNQANKGSVDQKLTSMAVQLRDLALQAQALYIFANNGAGGTAVDVLTGIGYDNTNHTSPGGLTDAQYAASIIQMFYALVGLYTGQTTLATPTDFGSKLAPLWAGQ